MAIQFQKAIKLDARARVALIGPAGSGKTYTALTLARLLAGPKGKIAALDSEHGSMAKYADIFEFDTMELDSFAPETFMEALKEAERLKYDVFLPDSLSHFWMGAGGALEWVDAAAKRSQSRDGMAGWKDFSPIERRMMDAMIASPCHIVATMRTKNEYSEVVDDRGKKKRVKIGLAPVQRQGLEYEFDLVGYMDDENNFITDKTRCPLFADKVIKRPSDKDFVPFRDWLKGATPTNVTPAQVEQAQTPPPETKQEPKTEPVKGSTQKEYITSDQAREVSNLIKSKGIDTKEFSEFLRRIGYVKKEGVNGFLCIETSQLGAISQWISEYNGK